MPSERANERRGVMPARPPIGRDHGGIQALDRAFLILDVMADAGGEAKLTEIAATAGLNVSTCHHLISTLHNWGYVARRQQPQLCAGVANSSPQRSLPATGGFAAPCAELCRSAERPDAGSR